MSADRSSRMIDSTITEVMVLNVAARPLEEHESELGDPAAFLAGAYRSVFLAYVPD